MSCVATGEFFACLTIVSQSLRSHLQCSREYLTLEVVENVGVVAENNRFLLIVDIFPFENFVDLMQCVFHRHSVRELGPEHALLRTDPIDAGEQSRGGHSQTVSTHSPSRISSSAVMSGQRSWRAVATMALSAGSRIAESDTDSSKTSNVYAWT
jgi:hypothetical protein